MKSSIETADSELTTELSDDIDAASRATISRPIKPLGMYSTMNSGTRVSGASGSTKARKSGFSTVNTPSTRPVKQYSSTTGNRASPFSIKMRRTEPSSFADSVRWAWV